MKKIFLLISAMLLTLAMNATTHEIGSGTSNILGSTVASAADGDVIILTDNGPYINSKSAEHDYTRLNKNLTIKAADGKNPVIQYEVPFRSTDGKTVKFIGITFDGTSLTEYDWYFRFYDANNNNLEFEDCEFRNVSTYYIFDVYTSCKANSLKLTNCYLHNNSNAGIYNRGTLTSLEINNSHFAYFTGGGYSAIENYAGSIGSIEINGSEFDNSTYYVIYGYKGTSINTLTINNCYFHNNTRSAVYLDSKTDTQACNSLTIENSTFANVSGGYNVIDFECPDGYTFTANASLSVNHCTFFKHPKRAIYWPESTNLSVTNCIFAQPSAVDYKSIECAGGSITNCLSYNSQGYSSAATRTDNVEGNPYFVNIESGSYDFSPASFSPAHNAGTDTKDMGDYLRWTSNDAAHVTTKNITAGTDAIKSAVEAAWPGDEIVLATGTYNESASIALNKNITIKAADGATPTVVPVKDFAISNGADVTIQGIKFNGASQDASNFIYVADNAANNLTIESCEFYNIDNIIINGKATSHVDECVINDCYFHNNDQQSIYFEVSSNAGVETCDQLTVTNSTFANTTALTNWISIVDIRPISSTNSIKVSIDHCTFYNNPTVDSGHANIRTKDISDVTVSNSIFYHPEAYARRATYCIGGGNINNCLTYNYTSDGTKGHAYGATVNAASMVEDPLFINTATGFAVKGDYTTGQVSPARKAATDGTCLGDPRWYTDEIIPSTNFASPYTFEGNIAIISGNIWYDGTNEYLYYNDKSENGVATWKINATKACAVQTTLNMNSTSPDGHKFKVVLVDADGNRIDSLAEPSQSTTATPIVMSGCLYIPEAGNYFVKLYNLTAYSHARIESITFTYAGGDVINIATATNTTLDVADAWFSGCTRADGGISFPSSSTSSAWMKWNTEASATKYYDVTVNITATNGHGIGVYIYEEGDPEPATPTIKESHSEETGDLALELGRVNLIGGKNYIVMVKNSTSGSTAKVTGVTFAPVVATATSLPNTLAFSNAVLSEKANITDGMLYFNTPNADKDPRGQWAQWSVTTDHDGLFLFTMGVTSTNGQNYKITIKDDGDNVLDYYETSFDSGDKTVKHYFALETGSYFVKVENTRSYSRGHLTSFVVTEPDDVVILDENATSNSTWASKVEDENTYDVRIIRTLKANMYNTFCLPFRVPDDMCKDLFGSDVEIYTLDEATVDDNILNLELHKSSDVWQGTPVFIKPSRNIVNPVFSGVKFKAAAPSASIGTNANFTGSFVATTLGPDPDILFLAQDNMLYYPQEEIPILGMRGWLVLHNSPSLISPRRANFILPDKMPTAIEIVNGDILPLDKTMKVIENGQLIIIRDGVRYNVMGVRVK